jgi:uncharacterized protein (TIGR03083 family)
MAVAPDHLGPPIDVRSLFGPERTALLDVLESLTGEQWRWPTSCSGWDVHDLAAHLLGGDLGRLARSRDGYVALIPRDGEGFLAFIDRINLEWVEAARRLSPPLLVDLLRTTGPWVEQLWAEADLDALGEPVSWAGRGPAPVWLDAARDYTEYWAHQQQLRDAVRVPLLDESRFLHPALDTFLRALPFTLADVGASHGASVAVVVDGDGGGTWYVQRGKDGWAMVAEVDRPTTTVVVDPDTLWRLCTRGITPQEAKERAVLRGDLHLADATLQIVSAIV